MYVDKCLLSVTFLIWLRHCTFVISDYNTYSSMILTGEGEVEQKGMMGHPVLIRQVHIKVSFMVQLFHSK